MKSWKSRFLASCYIEFPCWEKAAVRLLADSFTFLARLDMTKKSISSR